MKKVFILAIVTVFLFNVQDVAAQSASIEDLNSALGFDSTVNDVPESPIHFLVWLGMIVGSYLGFRKLK